MFSRSLLKVNRGVRCLSTPSNFKNVAVVGLVSFKFCNIYIVSRIFF